MLFDGHVSDFSTAVAADVEHLGQNLDRHFCTAASVPSGNLTENGCAQSVDLLHEL